MQIEKNFPSQKSLDWVEGKNKSQLYSTYNKSKLNIKPKIKVKG
jgi:hypothetical protein